MPVCGNPNCSAPATFNVSIDAGDVQEGQPVDRIYRMCDEHRMEVVPCGVKGCRHRGISELFVFPGTHPINKRPIEAQFRLCEEHGTQTPAGGTLVIDSPIPLSL